MATPTSGWASPAGAACSGSSRVAATSAGSDTDGLGMSFSGVMSAAPLAVHTEALLICEPHLTVVTLLVCISCVYH